VSVSVQGVRAEVLLHALEEKGVYVSAGSACASNKPAISETLKSIGLKKELLDSTIRFSFGAFTTEEEILYAAETLKNTVGVLRQFVRR
jgi:cysteine desulfurase